MNERRRIWREGWEEEEIRRRGGTEDEEKGKERMRMRIRDRKGENRRGDR